MKMFIRSMKWSFVLILIFASCVSAGQNWNPNLTPVRLVSSSESEIVLDNVRWGLTFDGEKFSTIYRRARIKYDEIEKVLFCTEDFPPKFIASHIYLTFIFKTSEGVKTIDGKQSSRGLVISATNRLLDGESPSSLVKAFFPKRAKNPWPLVFEVGTIEDRMQNSLLVSGNDIKIYPLKLEPSSAKDVLKAGLRLSLVDHSHDFYHVLFNNCVVAAFKILKEALGEKQFPDFWSIDGKLVSHKVSLPKLSASYLRKRGLGGERAFIPHNSREFEIISKFGNLKFDITKMPGYARATSELLPFALELQNYFEMAQASADLQKLVNLIGITHPDCFKYLAFKSEVDYDLDQSGSTIMKFARKKPLECSSYFVDAVKHNKLQHFAGFKTLNKEFIRMLNFETSILRIASDQLQSNLDHLKKLDR